MTYHARVNDDGGLALPASLARDFGLRPGDTVALERDGDTLRLYAPDGALARVRAAFQGYSVDRFLAERPHDGGE